MSERILVAVAWPYANYLLHVGQVAGAYLPADIFARYQRLIGNEVLMISGSDCHGTPITVTADRENVSPKDIVDRYHPKILEAWEKLGISFDLFTSTLTENHYETTQNVFTKLLSEGYLYTDKQEQLYDPESDRFLPDRYVEGICPLCNYKEARGDQCDSCGSQLDAVDLIQPRSIISGANPEIRESEHFFLRLSSFEGKLREWIENQNHWRRNVKNFTLGVLDEGLKDRAITRDISWGVPVPIDGYESKRIYVWFDAVIGYLSAAKEWAASNKSPESWKAFWEDENTRAYYFIGKDNIVFHTIIWPAMLLGYGNLNLPYNVPANQYVNFSKGQKQSKSKGTGNWILDLLDTYDPDVIRFYLTSILPETSDSEFQEEELIRSNNEMLIATWGNLVNRVFAMIHKNFSGEMPSCDNSSTESISLLSEIDSAFETIGNAYAACEFRTALRESLRIAQLTNRYLDTRAPWKSIKEDREHTAETLNISIQAISGIAKLLHPILPYSTTELFENLGFDSADIGKNWSRDSVPSGTHLAKSKALYSKLESD
mgnify:FL=1